MKLARIRPGVFSTLWTLGPDPVFIRVAAGLRRTWPLIEDDPAWVILEFGPLVVAVKLEATDWGSVAAWRAGARLPLNAEDN